MPGTDAASHRDIAAPVAEQERRDQLRFIACGSADDGMSALIERLFSEPDAVREDPSAALGAPAAGAVPGEAGSGLSLLLHGPSAEREQETMFDVAYRFFATPRRRFVVADTPGDERYTRNMVAAASTAELAVLLVDAREGLTTQTLRHAYICSLLGIRQVVLAVDRMDLADYSQAVFDDIAAVFAVFAQTIGIDRIHAIPLSALTGENVTRKSARMPWYAGDSLLATLESVPVAVPNDRPFAMWVQRVEQSDPDFQGVAGTVTSGSVAPGDGVRVLPSGRTSRVVRLVAPGGDLDRAAAGDTVTLVLEDEIGAGLGDLLCAAAAPPEQADQFAAHIVWMDEDPLYPGRPYLMKIGTRTVTGQITEIKYRIDVDSQQHLASRHLSVNEIAVCNVSFDRAIPFRRYADDPALGAFVLVDRTTNRTSGCGMLDFPLRRATNLHWQHGDIGKAAHSRLKGHRPAVLWFTGLSGAGKSTVANLVEQRLHGMGCHTYVLDGDNLRHGLNRDLGFLPEDRVENVRRVGEVARLFVDAGLIVLVSLISPYRNERARVREMLDAEEFVEVFVDTPLEECERRDPKGLYKKARAGELKNFTGVDSAYEAPLAPEVHLMGGERPADVLADELIETLKRKGIV